MSDLRFDFLRTHGFLYHVFYSKHSCCWFQFQLWAFSKPFPGCHVRPKENKETTIDVTKFSLNKLAKIIQKLCGRGTSKNRSELNGLNYELLKKPSCLHWLNDFKHRGAKGGRNLLPFIAFTPLSGILPGHWIRQAFVVVGG